MAKKKTTMMRINRWLYQARWAPSLGNSQAWVVRGRDTGNIVMLEISISPDYAKFPLVMDQYGVATIMSLGALVFNIQQCARSEGLQQVTLDCTCEKNNYFSTRITLVFREQLQKIPVEMTNFFRSRHTHRGNYSNAAIDPNVLQVGRQTLAQYYHKNPDLAVKNIEWGDGREEVVDILLKLEGVRWTNAHFRQRLLEEINFNQPQKNTGIPVAALNTTVSQNWGLWLARTFGVDGVLKPMVSSLLGQKVLRERLQACHRIFMMGLPKDNLVSWFRLGIALQEIWLHFNQNKIGFQPLSLNLIAYNHLRNIKSSFLGSEEAKIIEAIQKDSEQNMGLRFDSPMVGFRIGNVIADSNPVKAPRKELVASPLF
jgi:hypothetical protein